VPVGLLAAAAALSLLGCAAHQPLSTSTVSASTTPPAHLEPIGHSRLAARHELGGGDTREAQELIQRVETTQAAGQAAMLAGDEQAAFDQFDQAVELILRSPVDLDAYPEMRDRAERAIASMHDLAAAAAAEPDADEEAPEVPVIEDDVADGVAVARQWAASDLQVPMVDHPSVDAMARFYSGRAKDRFEMGLVRYGKYAPTVSHILEEEGVPPELAWLALVESNYNPHAYSRSRARGLWQFISETGRRYGLGQDFWVDERSDFEKATRSAARYLKDLYAMFGDWHLALAAYNAGEGKIQRGIKATGGRDFWRMRETRYLRRETKDYVPAFLAVLRIVRDPAAYGINFQPAPPLRWETTTINSCTDVSVIAQCTGTSVELISDLNPELKRGTTPGGTEPYTLRIPVGTRSRFEEQYALLPPEQRLTWHRHVVQGGETVAGIAQLYGTTTGAIMAANRLSSSNRVAKGSTLLIPAGPEVGAVPDAVLASRAPAGSDVVEDGPRTLTHRVRQGDTLSKIARRYGVSMSRIADWNALGNTNRIHVGQRLVIRGGSGQSVASGSTGGGSATTHVVRSGDTLSAIARNHGASIASLRAINGLSSSSVIRPGQKLKLVGSTATTSASASGRTHVVRRGDTLSKIAQRYNCSVSGICTTNGLQTSDAIHPGDRLTIPN
jgi:membrane-bound lytic murein transglycosylase D